MNGASIVNNSYKFPLNKTNKRTNNGVKSNIYI